MPPSSPRKSAILAAATAACLAGYLLFGFLPLLARAGDGDAHDAASYYYAVRAAVEGGDPYDARLLERTAREEGRRETIHPFFYPPPALLFLLPAAPFPLDAAYLGMLLANQAALAAAGWLLWSLLGRGAATAAALAFMALVFAPIRINDAWGQINLWVLVLIAGGLLLVARGRDAAGGALLGTAAMIKISPALLIVWLALRGRWRAPAGAIGAALLLTLASLPLASATIQARYYTEVLPEFRAGGSYSGLSISMLMIGNHSLPRLWHLVFPNPESRSVLSAGAAAASALSGLLLAAVTAVALRPGGMARRGDRTGLALEAGAVLVLMVILPNFAYDHHLVFLLPALAALWTAVRTGRLGARWTAPLLVAFACLASPRAAQEGAYAWAAGIAGGAGTLLRGLAMEARLFAACVVLAGCVTGARRATPLPGEVA